MPKPTEQEMSEMRDKAIEQDGRYHGLNYEQGVVAALEWAMGETADLPMED